MACTPMLDVSRNSSGIGSPACPRNVSEEGFEYVNEHLTRVEKCGRSLVTPFSQFDLPNAWTKCCFC